MQQVMCFLQEIGFRLNLAKSHPYLAETAVWLGVQWLPQSGDWHLPLDGQSLNRQMALDLLASPRVTRRQLERMVGLLNFACQVHRFLLPYIQSLTRSNTLVRATEWDRPVLSSSVYAGRVEVLCVSRSLVPRPALSCFPSPALAVDGCVSSGLGSSARACSGSLGKVVLLGGSPSRQPVGTPGCSLGGCVFQPPQPLAPCLYGQRDGPLRPGFVPRPLPESASGTAGLPVGGGLPESLVPGDPGPQSPECGGRCPQ